MIRLKDTTHQNTAAFLSNAIKVAEHYGFQPLRAAPRALSRPRGTPRPPAVKQAEVQFARKDERALFSTAKQCLACARQEGRPLLVWRVADAATRGGENIACTALEFHIIGAGGAIAEALLIVIADAIAAESGIAKRTVSTNSIGAVDSSARYLRDVSAFLRKHLDSISPSLHARAGTDPLGTLVQLFERGHPGMARAPQPTEYLTEEERRRFWDLLEYLEGVGIPYELDPSVLGSRELWSHTLYEISALDEETGSRIPFAFGGRYDPLASRLAGVPLSAAMISILCETRGRSSVKAQAAPSPSIYFAHLGSEARRKLLPVLEDLRRAGIPVHQSLLIERLGEQMGHAREARATHLVIMGHKEAVEGTALVRHIATNSQEAVPVQELSGYLRRHRTAVRV